VSEVTLVTDRDQAIPVMNTRTGARGVAFGESALRASGLELRFMSANADVQVGDLLTTSGVDGVYPPGLPVAQVAKIERRVDSAFARITCTPLALVAGVGQVLVLPPVATQIAARPTEQTPAPPLKKGGKK
jgi:rod shape-determining protein MreC